MNVIKARPGDFVPIGREGEHNARQVHFDISPWLGMYGDGVAELIYQRPGEENIYPVAVERQGHLVLWTITATDTAIPGRNGLAELRYYVDGALVKSEISTIAVSDALGTPSDAPEPPGQNWLDQVVQIGAEAKSDAESAETSKLAAERYAKNAASSETNASIRANAAQSSYESADRSAKNASTYANIASRAEKNARTYRNEAYEFAQQAAASGGGIKTVNGQKPDENGNVEVVAGTQANWSQNDPTANDYINGRTHYLYSGVLMDGQADFYTHDTFGKMWTISKAPQLIVGDSYTVSYNGSNYECVCQSAPAGLTADPDAVAMGNFSVVGGANTGEPFAMLISVLYNRVDIIDLSGANDVRVKISGTVLRKLSPVYLPDGVPYLGGIKHVLPECQPTRDEDGQTFDLSGMASLVAGEIYTVNWNGVDYSCVAQMLDTNGVKVVVLGNFGDILGGESSGEPFVIMYTVDESLALALDGSTSLTISIRQGEEARKLPVELLPDDLNVGGLTPEQISALDGMFKIIAYTEDASAAYAAFKLAFGIEDSGGEVEPDVPDIPDEPEVPDAPEVTLTSISATYSGGDVAVGTALTALTGIVVTAHYSDGSSANVTDYTLEGMMGEYIVEGLNSIVVRYGGKTVTIVVTGVAESDDGNEPESTEPVYRLAEATTFNADHVVDTGYKLLDVEKSWSVCIDCTDTSRGGYVWDASPNNSKGLALADRGGYHRTLHLAGSLYKDIGNAIGNYKIIVTHQKNTDLIEYHYIVPDTTELASGEITYTKYLTDANIISANAKTLKIGGKYDGSTASYKGTVHRFEIYERVLSEDEINEFVEFINSGGNEGGDESGGEGSTEPVYKLATATTFDGTSGIDTGYKLLDKDKSWSVCVDFTGNGNTVWDASPNASKGMTLTNRGGYFRTLYVALQQVDISGGDNTNHKVIVTHTKGTNSVQYHYIYEGASRVDSEVVEEGYLTNENIINSQTPLTVKLGANYSGTGDCYKGTVHRFEIYERALSADEINAFMGVSA